MNTRPNILALAALVLAAHLAPRAICQESESTTTTAAAKKASDRSPTVPQGESEQFLDRLNDLARQKAEALAAYQEIQKQARERYNEQMKELGEAEAAAAERILEVEKRSDSEAYLAAMGILMPRRVAAMAQADPEQQRATLDGLKSLLRTKVEKGLTVQDAALARSAGQALEMSGRSELAADAYQSFADLFGKSADANLRRFAEFFAATANRLALLGKEMEITGTTLDGKAFDWASYRGKVVLVDFWATWCGPCRAELPNVKKCYEIYHDRGFDVVGISLDRDQKALEKYIEDQKTPWVTLFDKEAGGSHPVAKHYGINAIPAMFFVDKEGKVVSLAARSSELNKLLDQHLGPLYATANPLAVAGKWEEATEEVAKSLEATPDDQEVYIALAVAQLMANNTDAYRATCSKAFERFGSSHPYHRAYLAQLCSLGADSGIDRDKIAQLLAKDMDIVNANAAAFVTGMHDFRSGRYEEAITRLPKAGDAFQVPACLFLRAIAHQKLGQGEEARELFDQATKELPQRVPGPEGPALAVYMPERWVTWGMLQILKREAEEVVRGADKKN